jgi:serine/threonine protein kinase
MNLFQLSDEEIGEILEEAKLQVSLVHQNIVRLEEYFINDKKQLCLVMELAD